MNELTLQQALTIYLKALCECANQKNLNDDELNEIIEKIVAQIDLDYKEVFVHPSITKKSAIYPSTNSVKEFLAEIKILAKKGD